MTKDNSTVPSESLILDRFRAKQAGSGSADWSKFVPPDSHPQQLPIVRALVLEDLHHRLAHHQPTDLLDYVKKYPQIAHLPVDQGSSHDEWLSRLNDLFQSHHQDAWWECLTSEFPAFAERCASLMRVHARSDGKLSATNRVVELGETVGDFELLSLVGEGTHGRVFLARELTLERLVALKVSRASQETSQYSLSQSEGRMLARLDHPNIVSVFREQVVDGKCLLAMQFVAGQSLNDWIARLRDSSLKREMPTTSTEAAAFFQWASDADVPVQFKEETATRVTTRTSDVGADAGGAVMSASYVRAMVRLVKTIALALEHAHGRGVLHHDIKPSNVMIDCAGTALLADFNVASNRDDATRPMLGGTISYMAPEHLKAIAIELGGNMDDVDVRSDLYSLGIVFYELLTGNKHWNALPQGSNQLVLNQLLADRLKSGPPAFDETLGIQSSLFAILQKSLSPAPADRYQTATEFVTDLTHWLEGRSSVFAEKGNAVERSSRWVRRNRNRVLWGIGAMAVIAGVGYVSLKSESDHLNRSRLLARQSTAELLSGNNSGAAESLGRAKARLAQLSLSPYLAPTDFAEVSQEVKNASRQLSNYELQRFTVRFGEAALSNIHQSERTDGADLIENTLESYGVLQREDWETRSPFIDLSVQERQMVAENVSELLLMSVLQRTNKLGDQEANEIRRRFPKEHRDFAMVQNLKDLPLERRTDVLSRDVAFECYLHGVEASVRGDDHSAYDWFSRSIDLRKVGEPLRFWEHYWQGYTCQRLGRHSESLIRYGTCLGQRPDFAWPPFNMGLACAQSDQIDLAEKFFRDAITIEPTFGAPYVALGAIQIEQENFADALVTFDEAIRLKIESPDLFQNRALALAKLGRVAEAINDLKLAIKMGAGGEAGELLRQLSQDR